MDAIREFREAMAAEGLGTDEEIVADDKLHRYRGPGDDPSDKDGFYVLHLDGIPAGMFGHWRIHPEPIKWHAAPDNSERLTPEEREKFQRQIAKAKKERDAEQAAKHAAAAERAQAEWDNAKDADHDHPYLCDKLVHAHGLKETADGRLIVPVYIASKIASLQYIDKHANKRFLKDSQTAGGYYRLGGKPSDLIYIAEGYATAASIYEAIGGGAPVVVAFSDGNLLPVAQALHQKHPKVLIVIAADNDSKADGNPGITYARDAAKAVHGRVAIPKLKDNPAAKCDFNDVAKIDGADAVRAVLEKTAGLLGVTAATIIVKPTEWEWTNRFPRGEVVMLDSDPGIGKTTLVTDLVARKSRGNPWPDGSPCQVGNVIVVSAEDSENTLVGRLETHDADLARVRIVPSAFERDSGELDVLTLPEHARELERIIRADSARMLILDPLSSFVSERVDSHRDASVRRVMAVLSRLAQSTGCTIICIRHLTKQQALENALYRGGGSIAIIGAARAGFLIGFDPNDKAPIPERLRVFAHFKANLGPITASLAFRIRADAGESFAHVEWVKGGCPLTANDLLASHDHRKKHSLEEAKEFLRVELDEGARPVDEIEKRAKAVGITLATLKRARSQLGIRAHHKGFSGEWLMSLPYDTQETAPPEPMPPPSNGTSPESAPAQPAPSTVASGDLDAFLEAALAERNPRARAQMLVEVCRQAGVSLGIESGELIVGSQVRATPRLRSALEVNIEELVDLLTSAGNESGGITP